MKTMRTIRLYELMIVLDELRHIARSIPPEDPMKERVLRSWAKLHTVIGLADAELDVSPPPDYCNLDSQTKWDC